MELFHGAINLREQGDVEGAVRMLEQAVDLERDFAEAHLELGRIFHQLGRIDDASDHYVLAAHFQPDLQEAQLRLGQLACGQGQFDEARRRLESAVALKPEDAEAHIALGAALYGLRLVDAAIARFRRALELNPESAEAHTNLGYVLFRELGQFEEGEKHIETALGLAPNNETVLCNWTMVLQQRGRFQEALDLSDRLLAANPHLHEVRLNRGLILLTRGEFWRGWPDYEARKRLPDFPKRVLPWPEWDGSSLADKTIFVYGEQGLGDEIMFGSCLPDVIRAAKGCVVECNPKLKALFSRSFPQARVIGTKQIGAGDSGYPSLDEIDFQAALGSLPLYLRREWGSFPIHDGYLKAAPARIAYWKQRLDGLGGKARIGISWRGGAPSTRRARRSIALELWRPILSCDSASFVSLQHDGRVEEIEMVRKTHNVMLHHWQNALDDYDETAALVCALDLVVTVQTAVAHLAGALGKTAWVMISAVPEWRYMETGESMPWYPSVRLFRQETAGDWSTVVQTVARNLGQVLK